MENKFSIDIIYRSLSKLKFQPFCIDKCCSKCEDNIIDTIVYTFLCPHFYIDDDCEINLISLINMSLCYIEKCTHCCKNYSYLLQIDRLQCIIKNFEKLLCQLRCLNFDNCCEVSEIVCTLLNIVSTLENIFSKINNIESLCGNCMCCRKEILDCILCSLEENINSLEDDVLLLSKIIVRIASQNVINCTPCSYVQCVDEKKCNSCNSKSKNYICDDDKF